MPSCVSSSQYIYIFYKFLFSLFSFLCFVFEVQQETKYHIKPDQIKSTKGQAVSKWHFIIRSWLNIEFILTSLSWFSFFFSFFCHPNYYLKFSFCFSTLWHNLFVGVGAATVQVRRALSLCVLTANWEH